MNIGKLAKKNYWNFVKNSKIRSLKIELFFIAKDLQYNMHLLSISYDLNTLELWKKFLSAVVTENIKRVFILFLRIIHADIRSSLLELSTLKRLHWIRFLVKIAYLRTAFLHYTCRYVSVWVKMKNTKAISKHCVI